MKSRWRIFAVEYIKKDEHIEKIAQKKDTLKKIAHKNRERERERDRRRRRRRWWRDCEYLEKKVH